MAFVVHGEARPGGSKRAFPIRKNGRIVKIATVEDAKGVKEWRGSVAAVAAEAMNGRGLLTGPIEVRLTFYRPRPQGHYGTGRNAALVKASAPAFPATRPDVLKLARAVEDALSGIVYRDDAQIVEELLRKRYGEPARCEIEVFLL